MERSFHFVWGPHAGIEEAGQFEAALILNFLICSRPLSTGPKKPSGSYLTSYSPSFWLKMKVESWKAVQLSLPSRRTSAWIFQEPSLDILSLNHVPFSKYMKGKLKWKTLRLAFTQAMLKFFQEKIIKMLKSSFIGIFLVKKVAWLNVWKTTSKFWLLEFPFAS